MSYSSIVRGVGLSIPNSEIEISSEYEDMLAYLEKKYDILISCTLCYVSDKLMCRISLNFPIASLDFNTKKPYGIMLLEDSWLPNNRLENTIVEWIQKENPTHLRGVKLNNLFDDWN